jgi:NADH-quinone oxidoreductase E subunit
MKIQSIQCECRKETEQEKYERVEEIIKEYHYKEDSLIQILHYAQGIFGYLPLKVQQFIAQKLNIPASKVSGVVTFYSFFSTKPKGRNTIRVCLGTACYVRGGKEIINKLKELLAIDVGDTTQDGRFTLEIMRCMGACGLAPAITINNKVYKQVNPDKLQSIIDKFS